MDHSCLPMAREGSEWGEAPTRASPFISFDAGRESVELHRRTGTGEGNPLARLRARGAMDLLVTMRASRVFVGGDGSPLRAVESLDRQLVVAVACGQGYTWALTADSACYSWGSGDSGQLGHGGSTEESTPRMIQALVKHPVTSILCGGHHSAAVMENGEVWVCGWGGHGQLGTGSKTDFASPVKMKGISNAQDVACGWSSTIVVTDEGAVFSCGLGDRGRLGVGHFDSVETPLQVRDLAGVVIRRVSCGNGHTLAVAHDGTVYSWGKGSAGQLGLGPSCVSYNIPQRISILDGMEVCNVACGSMHSAAVTREGKLYTWGYGSTGALGHGSTHNIDQPRIVQELVPLHVAEVACGNLHTACITSGGFLFTWGQGRDWQLGHDDTHDVAQPKRVLGLQEYAVVSVSCGKTHTCVVVSLRPPEEHPVNNVTEAAVPSNMSLLSQAYHVDGVLDVDDHLNDGFCVAREARSGLPLDEVECVLLDRRLDPDLAAWTVDAQELVRSSQDAASRARIVALMVSHILGGASGMTRAASSSPSGSYTSPLPIGQLVCGSHHLRCALFKFLCDQIGVPCRVGTRVTSPEAAGRGGSRGGRRGPRTVRRSNGSKFGMEALAKGRDGGGLLSFVCAFVCCGGETLKLVDLGRYAGRLYDEGSVEAAEYELGL